MANFNFNKVILGGRLTADPELKTTPSGVSVTTFSVAVNGRPDKNGQTTAEFFNVTAWRQTAEFITRYFRRASSICIVGSLHARSWTDQQGQKHYATEVTADEAYFVDAKSEMSAAQPAQQNPTPDYMAEQYRQMGQNMTSYPAPAYTEIQEDEEIPF